MTDWAAVTGLIFVSTITPGPNNLLALRAGFGGSATGPLLVIGGVQIGSMAMLCLCWLGLGAMIASQPFVGRIITIAGCLYLSWLAYLLMSRTQPAVQHSSSPVFGVKSVAAFQLANPKAWVMVTTAFAATGATPGAFVRLAALTLLCSTISLATWSYAGSRLSTWLADPKSRAWFDRSMGLLLMACAALLAVDQL